MGPHRRGNSIHRGLFPSGPGQNAQVIRPDVRVGQERKASRAERSREDALNREGRQANQPSLGIANRNDRQPSALAPMLPPREHPLEAEEDAPGRRCLEQLRPVAAEALEILAARDQVAWAGPETSLASGAGLVCGEVIPLLQRSPTESYDGKTDGREGFRVADQITKKYKERVIYLPERLRSDPRAAIRSQAAQEKLAGSDVGPRPEPQVEPQVGVNMARHHSFQKHRRTTQHNHREGGVLLVVEVPLRR